MTEYSGYIVGEWEAYEGFDFEFYGPFETEKEAEKVAAKLNKTKPRPPGVEWTVGYLYPPEEVING